MAGFISRRCSPDSDGNVVISRIKLPLRYDDVDFRFDGIGNFANNIVNAAGIYLLQSQEKTMIDKIREEIKRQVNSLIC